MTASSHVVVRARGTRSDIIRGRSAGPQRLLFPRAAGDAAWIVTSSLGGGLVDGDAIELAVEVEPGATAVITTQSSTKAYRGTTRQHARLAIADGALALVVPDPIVPYRDARFAQTTRVELATTGSLALAELITAGRVAHGERWAATRIDSKLEIVRAGTPLLVDRVVLEGDDVAARMRRFDAIGTVILGGPRARDAAPRILAELAAERPLRDAPVVRAGSPLDDGVIVRIAATRVELAVAALRALLREACLAAGEDPWSRKW